MVVKKLFLGAALIILMTPIFSLRVEAASNIIYISPASLSVGLGSSLSVQLRIAPNSTVNAVSANVNYNQGILQFSSLSLGAFGLCSTQNGGGGVVQLNCAYQGSTNYPSSDSLIATINFQAVGAGTSGLDITGANAVNPNNNYSYTNPGVANGEVTVIGNSTPPPSAPAPGTTSKNSPTSFYSSSHQATPSPNGASSSPSATPKTAPTSQPVIGINKLSQNFNYTLGNIDIFPSLPSTGIIKYGTSQNNLNQQIGISNPSSTLKFNFANSNLIPGTKYYYQITLSSPGASNYVSKLATFTTKGLSLEILVLDHNYHPIPHLKVVLHSTNPRSLITNGNGILDINNITPGIHHIIYKFNNKIYSDSIYIMNNINTIGNYQTSNLQTTATILTNYRIGSSVNYLLIFLIAIFSLMALSIIGLYLYIKKPRLIHDIEHYRKLVIHSDRI